MTQRAVVIGADAAGMSAAHQALRAAQSSGRELEVIALEATDTTSYSACGIPYWIGGEAESAAALVARWPDQIRAAGIDLRTETPAVGVDLTAHTVTTADGSVLEYDDLVLATGAEPIVPDWVTNEAGELPEGVGPVKTLADGEAWLQRLSDRDRPVLVLGGGYIGVEVAEAARRRGHPVTLRTRGRVMSNLAPELSDRVEDTMRSAGVILELDTQVDSLEREAGAAVVVALGITPRTSLVSGQAPLSDRGALRPDGRGVVADGLWSAGDCCEVRHRLLDEWVFLPLGTHANKHGRALGDHLGSGGHGRWSFDGALGTAITRFAVGPARAEVALTGLTPAQAGVDEGRAVSLITEGGTASGYLEESEPVAINVIADPTDRRLLGVQIVGGRGAGKRIDAAAACLWAGMSVDDLAWMDLSYAPPFATAWDILQVAARRLADRM